MREAIRFVPKSELERIQLVREARAIYESVFPSADAVNEQRYRASIIRSVGDADVHSGDDVKS
jgi:tRNA threonylcarbamoyladenosine modification (KEOPS) complex  Pcc1 subunit